jgi:hypothetical protein
MFTPPEGFGLAYADMQLRTLSFPLPSPASRMRRIDNETLS